MRRAAGDVPEGKYWKLLVLRVADSGNSTKGMDS